MCDYMLTPFYILGLFGLTIEFYKIMAYEIGWIASGKPIRLRTTLFGGRWVGGLLRVHTGILGRLIGLVFWGVCLITPE